MKKLYMIVFALIFSTIIIAEKYNISLEDILANGVVTYQSLNPCAVSDDASYFIATERVYDVKKVAKGNAYDLLIFRFEDQKLAKVDRINLSITHLVNVAYDHKKDLIYVVANRGNKIIRINAITTKQKTIFKYKKGRKGFKAGPFVFCHNSKLYATGWFYNKKQEWLGDYVAQIRIKKNKVTFKRKASLDYLYKLKFSDRGRVRTNYYVSGDVFFFSLIDQIDKQTHLLQFKKKKVLLVDKGYLITTFAATKNHIFYVVKNEDGSHSHYVKNLKTEKKYTIGRKNDQFTYPFINNDGLIVFKINMKQKTFNAYAGVEGNRYLLRRFMKNETLGAMKVTSDGKRYIFMGIKGFQIGTVYE